jgi:RNA polymerase sigma-70 factor (ECF subfamily)
MAAFGELVRLTTPSVRAAVASKVRNRDDAADLVQEVYLRALRALPSLEDSARFQSWLNTIARNVALDHHRARARRPTVSVEEGDDFSDDVVTTDDLVEIRELAGQVMVAIDRLSALDATLLAMVALMGFTPTDISTALGMSQTAAKVAVHRARKRLRQALLVSEAAGHRDRPGHQGCQTFRTLASRQLLVPAAIHARECPDCANRPARGTPGATERIRTS